MKKIIEKIKNWLTKIPNVCLLSFILGMTLAAFVALVAPAIAEWPFVPVFFLGVIVAAIKYACGKQTDLEMFVYYSVGAFIIQLFCWI